MKIGVLDSGLGGLSVNINRNKNDEVIYVADNLYFPYNTKTEPFIFERTLEILNFLQNKGCQKVVIACNTVNAILHRRSFFHPNLVVEGVINKTLNNCFSLDNKLNLTIIGTRHTISSQVYQEKLKEKKYSVISLVTPNLATIAEKLLLDSKIEESLIIKEILELGKTNTEALVLGCTHYSFLISHLFQYLPKGGKIVDANGVYTHSKHQLVLPKDMYQIFITKECSDFRVSAKNYLKKDVIITKTNL